MGPSGSGKTTLLNALAGQVPRAKRMTLRGAVFVNGAPQAAAAVSTGYVAQHDNFYSHSTVRETLDMTAALRLPRGTAVAARAAAVDAVLRKLDLHAVADTIVGGRKARGVSGGERKRLAIACELLSRPSLLFLDEPTTGLDAFQALKARCRCTPPLDYTPLDLPHLRVTRGVTVLVHTTMQPYIHSCIHTYMHAWALAHMASERSPGVRTMPPTPRYRWWRLSRSSRRTATPS